MLENVERIIIRPQSLEEFKEVLLKNSKIINQTPKKVEKQEQSEIKINKDLINENNDNDINLKGILSSISFKIYFNFKKIR